LLDTLARTDFSLKRRHYPFHQVPLAPLVGDLAPYYAMDADGRISSFLAAWRYA
jgi:hypothetical protein